MITSLAKPISLTLLKNITDKSDNWMKQLLVSGGLPPSPKQLFPLFHFTDNVLLNPQKQQPPILPALHPLEELKFQYAYHLQPTKPQQQELTTCPSTQSTNPSQPHISVQHIQTLQFEANSPIEDKLAHNRLQSINAQCISIFDGHGGNSLSDYASKKITELIDSYLFTHLPATQPPLEPEKSLALIQASITWAYNQIQQSFYELLQHHLKTGNKDLIKIGTCAITCVVWQSFVVIANCGDSQAIIVTQDESGLCYFKANDQLNTSNLQELNRIQKEFQGVDDQVLIKSKQNNKIYIKGILQPTRTLGDYYLKKEKLFHKIAKAAKTPFKGPYINHTPEFKVIPIKSNFKHLILASDGLWDFATKKEILKIVQTHNGPADNETPSLTEHDLSKAYIEKPLSNPPKTLASSLRDHVLQKCAKKKGKSLQELMLVPPGERRNYCDDISIICLSFGQNSEE